MKKIILVMAILFANLNLYAAKALTVEPDENGRLYSTAYFDIKPEGASAVYDVITYTKRPKSFNWEKFYTALKSFKGDKLELVISTRVEIPADITTSSVYITIGKTYYFYIGLDHWSDKKKAPTRKEFTKMTKSDNSTALYKFTTSLNEKVMSGSDSMLVKTKKDAFGNNYVDLKINFYMDLQDSSNYIHFTPEYDVRRAFSKLFENVSIKVAPKSRTFQNKWQNPKIYVLDE